MSVIVRMILFFKTANSALMRPRGQRRTVTARLTTTVWTKASVCCWWTWTYTTASMSSLFLYLLGRYLWKKLWSWWGQLSVHNADTPCAAGVSEASMVPDVPKQSWSSSQWQKRRWLSQCSVCVCCSSVWPEPCTSAVNGKDFMYIFVAFVYSDKPIIW